MKSERIRWKRTKGRQQLLLNKVYDAVTEEFTRDAKPEAIEAFGDAYDETRDTLSGSGANASLLN